MRLIKVHAKLSVIFWYLSPRSLFTDSIFSQRSSNIINYKNCQKYFAPQKNVARTIKLATPVISQHYYKFSSSSIIPSKQWWTNQIRRFVQIRPATSLSSLILKLLKLRSSLSPSLPLFLLDELVSAPINEVSGEVEH